MTTQSASVTPAPAARTRRWGLLLAILLPLFAIGGVWVWRAAQLPEPGAGPRPDWSEHSALQLDLSAPDALIETAALSALPRDLLALPVLGELLSEDFVFYYQSNADRLGIAGALRRIAYEHELDWREDLLVELLDAPAEIALWQAQDGKPRHAVAVLQSDVLAGWLPRLLAVASDDRQLSAVGVLAIGAQSVPVYRLRYNYDRAVLFAAHGDRLIVVGTPELLQSSEAADSALGRSQAQQLQQVLSDTAVWAQRFHLDRRSARHRLTVSADYLAMGYGRFLPQLAAIRVQQDEGSWVSAAALHSLDAAAVDFAPLWQAAPIGAAACVAVPTSAEALASVLRRLQAAVNADLTRYFSGPAALCWYPESRLHTPLLITQLNPEISDPDPALQTAFERMIGSFEPGVEGGRFALDVQRAAEGARWQRVVGSSWGRYPADQADAETHSYARYFKVSLARRGRMLLFSLDDALVDQAIASLERRFPPLAEQLPEGTVPLYLAPAPLAQLIEQETLASLPADVEAVFRNAAQAHWLPKLGVMAKHAPIAVQLPATAVDAREWNWQPLQWTALR